MDRNGTTLPCITALTTLELPRIGLRTKAVSGVKNIQIKAWKDGPRSKGREAAKNGMKIGIKNVDHFQRRRTKKETSWMSMSPTETISKNKIPRNGART